MLARAADFLTPTPKTDPDVWARANRSYPKTAGLPGPRDPGLTGYMLPFGRRAHAARHRRVVAVTAAQSGKTDNILDLIGARLDQRPAPILYVGPSDDFVNDQFEPRLMSLFDNAATLRDKVIRGRRMKKKLKTVAGVRVRLASARSSTALKSDPFALGVVDEYDEMVANIQGQGDPLGLVEARGETYADFCTVIVSTPSQGVVDTEIDPVNGLEFWRIADPEQVESPIWRLFQSGTRHHFAWPCPHCGTWFVPMSKHLEYPKDATPAQARKVAHLRCPNGCVIDDGPDGETKRTMIRNGVQIAPGQTIEDALAERNEPENSTWSCWTSGLCSPFVTWGERAERLLAAKASGEPDKIQTVMNANFGELYSLAATGDAPAHDEVLARALPYAEGEIPRGGVRLVMAVDVQKFSLIYGIRAFGARGTSWLVKYGYLYGPTDQDEVWQDLEDLMTQPVGGMHIERVAIDSGFRPNKKDQGSEHKVYEFCRRWSWLCVPTKGRDVMMPPYRVSKIEVKKDGRKASYSLDLVHLGTDFFKSLVVSRIRIPMGAPGAFYVHADTDEDYAKQVTSEVRVIENGRPKWIQRAPDNHFFDVEAMLAGLAYSMNVQRIPEGVERRVPDEPPVDPPSSAPDRGAPPPSASSSLADGGGDRTPEPPPAPPAPAAPTPAAPAPQTDMRSRFANLGRRFNR